MLAGVSVYLVSHSITRRVHDCAVPAKSSQRVRSGGGAVRSTGSSISLEGTYSRSSTSRIASESPSCQGKVLKVPAREAGRELRPAGLCARDAMSMGLLAVVAREIGRDCPPREGLVRALAVPLGAGVAVLLAASPSPPSPAIPPLPPSSAVPSSPPPPPSPAKPPASPNSSSGIAPGGALAARASALKIVRPRLATRTA